MNGTTTMTSASNRNGHVNGGSTMSNGDHPPSQSPDNDRNPNRSGNPYYLDTPERIAIIGAGVAGIAMASALQNANYTNYVVYDKQSNIGGLWLQNYPNIAGRNYCVFVCVALSFSRCVVELLLRILTNIVYIISSLFFQTQCKHHHINMNIPGIRIQIIYVIEVTRPHRLARKSKRICTTSVYRKILYIKFNATPWFRTLRRIRQLVSGHWSPL